MGRGFACVTAQDSNGCGPAALATVARHYGLYVSLEWLRGVVATDLQGTSLVQLQESAEDLGLCGSCGKAKAGVLNTLPLPAIAHFNDTPQGHLVVLHRVGKKRVVIADPAKGVVRLRRDKFQKRWSGYLLLLAPGPNFERKGEPHSSLPELIRIALLERRTIFLSLVLAFLLIGFGFATSFLAQLILDRVIPRSDSHLLWLLSTAAIGCVIFRFGAGIVRQIGLAMLGYKIEVSMGLRYARKVLSLPLEFFERRSTGDIFSRTSDVTSISLAISRTLVSVLPDVFFLLSSGAILLCYSVRLTLVVFCFVPLLAAVVVGFLGPLNRKEREIRERITEWANRFIEAMQNIKTLKAFCSEEFAYERTKEIYLEATANVRKRTVLSDLLGGFCSLLTQAGLITLLLVGTLLALKGGVTTGQLIFFYTSAGLFLNSVEHLPGSISSLQEAMIGIERLHEIYMLEAENSVRQTKVLPPSIDGQVELSSVAFWHRRRAPVLSGISLKISRGEWLGILGETGSGKSTLANLIAGLYPVREGEILIDGVDLSSLRKESLRNHVAIVFQDARLMRGTIHENIALGNTAITREQVREAAKLAGIDEFINSLPRNYEYDVGPFGSLLSSGQRQRIAIARALLRDAAVLILDEATSNLDVHTELQIMNAIKQQRQRRTTIIITHRLSTALLTDRIVVLKSGVIAEQGTHQELLEKNGCYNSMWQAFGYAPNKREPLDKACERQKATPAGQMLA